MYPYFADSTDIADICFEAKTDLDMRQVLLMIRAQVWMRMSWWNGIKVEGWLFLKECGLSSNDPRPDDGIMEQPCQDARCNNKLALSCPLLLLVLEVLSGAASTSGMS